MADFENVHTGSFGRDEESVGLLFPQIEDGMRVKTAILCTQYNSLGKVYSIRDILCSVGSLWERVTQEKDLSSGFDVEIVSRNAEPFYTIDNDIVNPSQELIDEQYDLVIVPDLSVNYDLSKPMSSFTREQCWVIQQINGGATVATICTGLLMIADLEAFRGETVALHWAVKDFAQAKFKHLNIDSEAPLCVSSGGNLLTTGACSSWEELVKYIVIRYCGNEELRRITSLFMFGNRDNGLRPFANMRTAFLSEEKDISSCLTWLDSNLAAGNIIEKLTEFSGQHQRTLKRRFKKATGKSPIQFVQALRVEKAKVMLVSTSKNIESIAADIGYRDTAYFTSLFKNLVGITPMRYRKMHTISSLPVAKKRRAVADCG